MKGILSMAAIGTYLVVFGIGFVYVCRGIYATLINVFEGSRRGPEEPLRRVSQKDVDTTDAVVHVVLITAGVSAYLAFAYVIWEVVMSRILQAL